jgi:CubicO group peptidase (beta-lactamase class C family)
MYRSKGFEFAAPNGMDLAAVCDSWAALPLLFHPGTEWNYGVSTDVLGRVVEVVSGQRLDEFFAEHVLGPLDMTDTAFSVGADDLGRLATLYMPNPRGGLTRSAALGDAITHEPSFLSGGGGLVSTAADYHRFTQLLARGGALNGVRLLSPRTVAYMTRNHLPGNADLEAFGRPVFAESTVRGVGFGLGVSVVIAPPRSGA